MKLTNKIQIVLFLTLGSFGCIGQTVEKLKVTVNKEEISTDDFCIHTISIKNACDTTVCILHSMFLDLTSSVLKGLALFQQDKNNNIYSLRYSIEDTLHSFESLPYRAECILPFQTLEIKISTKKLNNKKAQKLSFEYLYEPNFCYKTFMIAMRQMTTWYLKYTRYEKIIDLPFSVQPIVKSQEVKSF